MTLSILDETSKYNSGNPRLSAEIIGIFQITSLLSDVDARINNFEQL